VLHADVYIMLWSINLTSLGDGKNP
ncbi:uncharacterized protein METZ01_LOCUS174266, partial [marine metagenome]